MSFGIAYCGPAISVCCVTFVIRYNLLWVSYQCRAVYNVSFGIAYCGLAISVVLCKMCHSVLPTVGQLSVSCSVQCVIRYCLPWASYYFRAVYNVSLGIAYCGLVISDVLCKMCHTVLPTLGQLSESCSVQCVIRYCLMWASY